ncbi:ABC transporter permease [Paenibacillus baekrokdamisoli]|uniref:ABC transporter permease n=1 Tax=Paenibacillus baekrokdamisoli TaxID=1712516 RepID=A0A3G9JGP0_9BACL|nr:sugar ABC transporter permease [Paenibacillus baekrokdamisoli]MBB3070902.1 ABC-type sugar transport system permease subunit [Paenibacillus baekrokdamisoli]BBH22159.1 ABC transporter permease [Paenibacillus baekrokdamisoli]
MSSPRRKRKELLMYRWKRYGVGYLFVLPWLLGFLSFMAYPIAASLYMSFHDVRVGGGQFRMTWKGWANYHYAFVKDNVFPVELILYMQEMLLIIPIIVIFALLISLFLNQEFPLRFLYRGIFFLPVIFATGQVLTELFSQGAGELPFMKQYNLENLVQQYIGPQFADPVLSVLSRTIIILWYSGVQIIIFLAGLQSISRSVYEAVWIDGASPWDSFWKITLPNMVPFISLCTIYTIVELFTFPLNPVIRHIRTNMFAVETGYGYSNALAWIYFVFILLLLGLTMLVFRRIVNLREGKR